MWFNEDNDVIFEDKLQNGRIGHFAEKHSLN